MLDGEGNFNRHLSSLGVHEPSLLAFAHHDGIPYDEESMLRLIVATSRFPFHTEDGVLLNVECFGPSYKCDDDDVNDGETGNIGTSQNNGDAAYNHNNHRRSFHNSDQWPLLLYVHGICESAETWGVQTLAQYCAKHCWRLVVLELAGHGLSGDIGIGSSRVSGGVGSVSSMGRATCPDFDELVNHVVEFTIRMGRHFSRAKGMVLCGGSLGGALVAYAVKDILAARHEQSRANSNTDAQLTQQPQLECPDFYGITLLAPALGIDPGAIPPSPVVVALRYLSYIFPSQGILTPIEHPTYACPPSSTRNFSGRWPLSTSNMLLDITSRRVPNDVESSNVQTQMEGLQSLCVITGDRDEIVPLTSVMKWFEAVTNLSSNDGEKIMIVLKGAGHGFFHERTKWGLKSENTKKLFVDNLFDWLNGLASKDFE